MCLRSVQYSPIHSYLKLSFSISLEADRLFLKDLSQLVTSELNQRLKTDATAMEKEEELFLRKRLETIIEEITKLREEIKRGTEQIEDTERENSDAELAS